MKHKHYEMIVAKAENMELVVFEKSKLSGWVLLERHLIPDSDACEYFLCLPQHKEACFHWLNGGDVQVDICGWSGVVAFDGHVWSPNVCFMSNVNAVRIKPKKEKRWIGFHKCGLTKKSYETKEEAMMDEKVHKPSNHWQFIEIEVEV